MKARTCVVASMVLAAFSLGAAAAEERVAIKISSFTPPPHWTNSQLFQPWAKELEKKSGGKVRATLFPGNSAFGKIDNQTDQVKAGATDIAWVMNGVPRGRFLRSLIMDLPFMAPDAYSSTNAMWALLPTLLKEDYAGFKVLAITCHNAGDLFFRNKKVDGLEDIKGLRIRSPSSQVQALLQHLGAVPITMGPGQIYEGLEKGTIDGIATVYDGIRGFRLENSVKHALSAGVYVTCFNITMNQERYAGLPPDVRKLVDDTTGQRWIEAMPRLWDKNDEAGRKLALSKGLQVVPVSPQLRAKWRAEAQPVIDQQLADLEKQGISNAREIHAEMVRQVERFSKKQK
jgi:TRAP-type C4-dicarboxylate transport system substrate-binding protein